MSKIICITGWFPKHDKNGISTGEKEFVVSHGIDEDTGKAVILPNEHPSRLGAHYDGDLGEYVIPEKKPQPQWGKGAV